MKRWNALLITLVSGMAVSLPYTAVAEDIDFFVTNNASQAQCVAVSGPALRTGGSGPLTPGTQRDHFYTAETGIFSPFGLWKVEWFDVFEGVDCDNPSSSDFCLVRSANEIDITITDSGLTINAALPPCNDFVQATAFLGHVPGQRSLVARGSGHRADRDRDVFRFEGDAGDAVVVSLEPDGGLGSAGEHARLVLRDHRGGALSEQADGPLPLEVGATLPGPGTYEVVVEEQPRSSNPFRGHYRVTLQSTSEVDLALEPLASVEP